MREYDLIIDGELVASSDFRHPPQIAGGVDDRLGGSMVLAQIDVFNCKPRFGEIIELYVNGAILFKGYIINVNSFQPNRTDKVVRYYCRTIKKDPEVVQSFRSGLSIESATSSITKMKVESKGDIGNIDKNLSFKAPVSSVMDELSSLYKFKYKIRYDICTITSDTYKDSPYEIPETQKLPGGTVVTEEGARIKVRLSPELTPYRVIDARSLSPIIGRSDVYIRKVDLKDGLYKIIDIGHAFDFYGSTWETSMRCINV